MVQTLLEKSLTTRPHPSIVNTRDPSMAGSPTPGLIFDFGWPLREVFFFLTWLRIYGPIYTKETPFYNDDMLVLKGMS
jgi:hypothetical protein